MHPLFAEALLLRSIHYRDSDLVVTLATPSLGKIGALARGARKSLKRFGSALDYFNVLRAEIKPARSGLATLAGVELVKSYNRPRAEMDAYFAASHYLEVARLGGREGDSSPELYHLLVESLEALEKGARPEHLTRVFRIRLVSLMGYSLTASDCPHCGASLTGGARYVHGAPSCHGCAGTAGEKISAGSVKTLNAALTVPLGKLGISEAVEKEIGPVVDDSLVRALGVRPKTMEG